METATMGEVRVAARIENLEDVLRCARGEIAATAIRSVEVSDALVDTGAVFLSAPRHIIDSLGLTPLRSRLMRTTNGVVQRTIFASARLTIDGRDANCDVAELPDDCPVLIGQIPLEGLDFVVDPVQRRLVGNPAHGGAQMYDLY